MNESDHPYFIPERPPLAELQSARGVQALMDKALRHLVESGADCGGCGGRIDPQRECWFILGQPAPLFACGDPACVARLQRLAEEHSAPMLGIGNPRPRE